MSTPYDHRVAFELRLGWSWCVYLYVCMCFVLLRYLVLSVALLSVANIALRMAQACLAQACTVRLLILQYHDHH